MQFRIEVNNMYSLLVHQFSIAIGKSVLNTDKRCKGNPHEPDFIAGLVLDFTPDLYSILVNLFPKFRFSVTGVFLHQRPIVKCTPPLTKMPELGDLLFVFLHTDLRGEKHYNSLLFQAKMSDKENFTVSTDEQHQLRLYTEWPDFEYVRAGKTLNTQTRSIQPKSITTGAQYMLIDKRPHHRVLIDPSQFPIGCSIPGQPITLDNSLSIELTNFLRYKTGRSFEKDVAKTQDEWTKMIWDLLNVSKSAMSRRINAGLTSFPRTNSKDYHGACFMSADGMSEYFKAKKDLPIFDGDSVINIAEDDGGVSVIMVESRERDG